jgi:beta-galactosidase/beta-glucuronidase
MEYDLKVLKLLGFNMVRKHIKIEPDLFYYACDRLGLLVWQVSEYHQVLSFAFA